MQLPLEGELDFRGVHLRPVAHYHGRILIPCECFYILALLCEIHFVLSVIGLFSGGPASLTQISFDPWQYAANPDIYAARTMAASNSIPTRSKRVRPSQRESA